VLRKKKVLAQAFQQVGDSPTVEVTLQVFTLASTSTRMLVRTPLYIHLRKKKVPAQAFQQVGDSPTVEVTLLSVRTCFNFNSYASTYTFVHTSEEEGGAGPSIPAGGRVCNS
jgi:hypothetical protein